MRVKDYYSILQIPPGATIPDVKKAYRRLAMQFHPDKMDNTVTAGLRFEEIKEAYEVLSNPRKKREYLEKRWYNQVMNLRTPSSPVSPEDLLKQLIRLRKHTYSFDRYRMDQYGLYEYLDSLFSKDILNMLNQEADPSLLQQITDITTSISEILSPRFRLQFLPRLQSLAGLDAGSVGRIAGQMKAARRSRRWTRWRLPLLLMVVVALCIAIYFLSL